jgi:hypothetical protein
MDSVYPTWKEAESFVMNAGLSVFLVVFSVIVGFAGFAWAVRSAWSFFKPQIKQGFDKHFSLIDKLTLRVETESADEDRTRRAIGHVGRAVEALAPEERRPVVRMHIEALEREIRPDSE